MKKDEYDFSNAKRGAVINSPGKTRITIHIDTDIIEEFRTRSEVAGHGYQTMINQALREYLDNSEHPVSARELREILREELRASN